MAAVVILGAKPAWDMVLGPQPHGAGVTVYYQANVHDATLPNVTREDAQAHLPERFVELLDFVERTRTDSEQIHLDPWEVAAVERFLYPRGIRSGWMFQYEGVVMEYVFVGI